MNPHSRESFRMDHEIYIPVMAHLHWFLFDEVRSLILFSLGGSCGCCEGRIVESPQEMNGNRSRDQTEMGLFRWVSSENWPMQTIRHINSWWMINVHTQRVDQVLDSVQYRPWWGLVWDIQIGKWTDHSVSPSHSDTIAPPAMNTIVFSVSSNHSFNLFKIPYLIQINSFILRFESIIGSISVLISAQSTENSIFGTELLDLQWNDQLPSSFPSLDSHYHPLTPYIRWHTIPIVPNTSDHHSVQYSFQSVHRMRDLWSYEDTKRWASSTTTILFSARISLVLTVYGSGFLNQSYILPISNLIGSSVGGT